MHYRHQNQYSPQPHTYPMYLPTNFQSAPATLSPNIQALPPGQILYMLTPVAVTTQNPINPVVNIGDDNEGNNLPKATLVMGQ